MSHSIFFGFIFLTLSSWMHAALVWSEDGGWRIDGGVLEMVSDGEGGDGRNAIDLMNKAKQAQEKGSEWDALSTYKSVYKKYPNSIFAPEAHYQRGLIYTDRHQFEKANKEFTTIIRRYPDYEKFNLVIGGIFAIGEQIGAGARPHYWGLIPGFRNYEMGSSILEGVIEKAPFSEFAPRALMHIAHIAEKRKSPEEAIDALDRLINNYPESPLAQDAYLKMGDTYSTIVQGEFYDQGATREAISYFEDFIALYPDAENIQEAEAGLAYMRDTLARSKLYLGEFYYKYRNNNRAALVFYNEAITIEPQSEAAQEAQAGINRINDGVPAPSSPVDWMFGRYQSPVSRDELPAEDPAVEAFEVFEPETNPAE